MKFSIRISTVNVTADSVTFTEDCPDGKVQFLCSVCENVLNLETFKSFVVSSLFPRKKDLFSLIPEN